MTTMVEYGLPTTGFPPPRGPIPDDACPACKHSLTRVDARGHRCTQAVCGCIEHRPEVVMSDAFNPFALEDDCDAFD